MTTSRSTGTRTASGWPRVFALVVGIAYTIVGIVGFFLTGFDDFFGMTGDTIRDPLNLNWADNWLHLGSAILGLVIALGPVPRVDTVGHGRTESAGPNRRR